MVGCSKSGSDGTTVSGGFSGGTGGSSSDRSGNSGSIGIGNGAGIPGDAGARVIPSKDRCDGYRPQGHTHKLGTTVSGLVRSV